MSEFKPTSGGDPAACASAIVEFYRLIEASQEAGKHEVPVEFTTGDAGFCRGGCQVWKVTTIGGPSGEVVLHIFEDDEQVGWVNS